MNGRHGSSWLEARHSKEAELQGPKIFQIFEGLPLILTYHLSLRKKNDLSTKINLRKPIPRMIWSKHSG